MSVFTAVFILLLGLKLTHAAELDWIQVFSPYIFSVALQLIVLGLVAGGVVKSSKKL